MIDCIGEKALCVRLGVRPRTVQQWRVTGDGPPYIRLGARMVAYRIADVDAWVAARTFVAHAAEKKDEPGVRTYELGRRDAFATAADMLNQSAQAIRLAMGEMTAQEMRTVKAALEWRAAALRNMAEVATKPLHLRERSEA